jgi:hypothetical protein
MKNNTMVSLIAVIVLTLIAEVPAVTAWLEGAMLAHGHTVILVEGLIALVLVWWGGQKERMMVKS